MTKRLTSSIQKFIKIESFSGILLFGVTLIALAWANSPWAESYTAIWNYRLGLEISSFELNKPLILWINDGLMAIFFFLIGLEIKRELVIGELNSTRKATLPLFAAIGGMTFPAVVYFLLNDQPETLNGWAVPMATDIAFSLAIIKLLGDRVPLNLKIFLTAFAIVDDLGAVLIIAIFYSTGIKWSLIVAAMFLIALLFILSNRNLFSKYLLVIIGVVVWTLFLKAGIHPTIAGVLLAFTVPIRQKVNIKSFSSELAEIVARLQSSPPESTETLSKEQIAEIDELDEWIDKVQSPLQRMEHGLHNWVAYCIMPIFALANAGVAISAGADLNYSLLLVIAIALIVGNPIGIGLLTTVAIRTGWAVLPEGVTKRQIVGVSFLAGVGFTMSVFIANLAFSGSALLLDSAKVGILLGSVVSGLIGYLILRSSAPLAKA